MNLKSILDKKNIVCNVNVSSRKMILEFIIKQLSSSDANICADEALSSIYTRERMGRTYIGKNIYMPHCRVKGLLFTKIIIIKLKNDYYDDQFKEDVSLVIAVFFPEHTSSSHLTLLKKIAGFFKSNTIQEKFQDIESSKDLYDLILSNS